MINSLDVVKTNLRSLRSKVSLGSFVWLCILLLVLLSRLIGIPEIIKAFAALPLLVVVPLEFGRLVMRPVRSLVRDLASVSDLLSEWVVFWMAGVFSLTMGALLLQMFFPSLFVKNLPWLVTAIVAVSLSYDAYKRHRGHPTAMRLPAALQSGWTVILVLAIGLVPVLIYRSFGPFPVIRTGFGLAKIVVQPARRMINDGYITSNLPTHKSSLTVLIALVSILLNVDPLSTIWSAPFLLYAAFALGFYVWAYGLSKNKVVSVLVVLFGVFVMAAAPTMQGIPLRTRSSTVQYALLPLTLYLIQRNALKSNYRLGHLIVVLILVLGGICAFFLAANLDRWISPVSSGTRTQIYTLLSVAAPLAALILRSTILARNQARDVFLFLVFLTALLFQFHVFEAPLYLVTILAYVGLHALLQRLGLRPVFWLSIGLVWLFLILQLTGLLDIPEISPLSNATFGETMLADKGLDFARKYGFVKQANGYVVLVLLALGTLSMVLSGGQTELLIASMVTLTLLVYFLPDKSTYRFHKEIVPFMAYALAWILYKPYALLKSRLPARKGWLATLAFVLMLVVALPGPVHRFYAHYSVESLPDGSFPTIMTDYEYSATDWLRTQTRENVRLVSDYYTMQVMSELSDKVSLIEFPINPDALSDGGLEQLRHIKENVFREPSAHQAYDAIFGLVGTEAYQEKEYLLAIGQSPTDASFAVVLSGRTSQWIQQEDLSRVNLAEMVRTDVDPLHLQKFYDLRYFDLSYQVGQRLYIFQVKAPVPGAQGSARDYVNSGNLYWSRGDAEAAVALYRKALDVDPLEPEAYIALGEAYRAQGNWSEAGAAFQEAARLRPNDANLQMAVGRLYARQDRLAAAVEAYETAVALRPDLRDPHVALGRGYLQQGAAQLAVAQFEIARQLCSVDAELHADLGRAYAALGKSKEAEAAYRQAIELGVNKPGFHYADVGSFTSGTLDDLQRHGIEYISVKSGVSLTERLASQPALFSPLYHVDDFELYRVTPRPMSDPVVLGYIHLQQREWERAIRNFDEALKMHSNEAWAHIGLGRAYQAQSRMEQAMAEYQGAVAARSAPPDTHVLQVIGRYLDLDPEYVPAYLSMGKSYHGGPYADSGDSFWPVLTLLNDPCLTTSADDQIHRSVFVIDREPKGVLFQHPPSRISYPVELLTPARLRYSLALAPEVWQPGKGDGVQFDIYVDDGSVRWHPFSEYIDAKNIEALRRWHDREIEIYPGPGQVVTITFATGPGPRDDDNYDWAGWGEPRLVRPIAYDFLAEFPVTDHGDADQHQVRLDTITIDGEARSVLFQQPTSQISYHVDLPEGASLYFGLGLDPTVWVPDKGDGVEYNIYIRRSQGTNVLRRIFHIYIDPKNDPGYRHWLDQELDLSSYGGQSVDILFEALPGPDGDAAFDWGGWSRPVLIAGPRPKLGTDSDQGRVLGTAETSCLQRLRR